jgi:hypothetical protein
MAQKTNLNINPYYDDFDSEKNFYKVLFKPGFPVQSRELTSLQSILQNQVEDFGSHIFKEGSMVIPGNITYDGQFYSVKINSSQFGVDISVYIDNFVGKTVVGQVSGTTAKIQKIVLPDESDDVEYITLYVKYLESDENFEFTQFQDGELLYANENIVYGNTTISSGTSFASLIPSDATSIGSAVFIGNGVYFIRGYFVNVSSQDLILDYYTNTPSYRVGLKITESLVSAKEDESLYDNAKGFTNYAAPGADRLKITLSLIKKSLDDTNDTDFVELLRLKDGKIKKVTTKTDYNKIRDYLAERTFDESGDYTVNPFIVTLYNSLNDRLGNDGVFFNTELTEQRNVPTDDLACLKISPGKAYVRGYDIQKTGTEIIDLEKPRDTAQISNVTVPFEMGNILRVNNVTGLAKLRETVQLFSQFGSNGTQIGEARVYSFNLTDAPYLNSSTSWDLRLYDIQTYTRLSLNQSVGSSIIKQSFYVKGKSSGASGFATADGSSDVIFLRQTSGSFSKGEALIVNGIEISRTIKEIRIYNTQNIKSVRQLSPFGYSNFTADSILDRFNFPGGISQISITTGSGGISTVTSTGRQFVGIMTDTIVRYQKSGFGTETYNRISSISSDSLSFQISGITSVTGVFDGSLPSSNIQVNGFLGAPIIRGSGTLYAPLPEANSSLVDLSSSDLYLTAQVTGKNVDGNNEIQLSTITDFSGISNLSWSTFDQERYGIGYSGGSIGTINEDSFNIAGNTLTIRGLNNSLSDNDTIVNVTTIKNGIQSKIKNYTRSTILNVNRSKLPESGSDANSSKNDGLTYNQYYGLRVQDEEISLNYPDVVKVLSVYESLNTSDPTFDQIEFTSTANVSSNTILGENIIGQSSGTVARVITNITTTPSSVVNTLGIIYLNENRFSIGESVLFEESNISTVIESIVNGSYRDITTSFKLNRGQKNQYYDYSRLVRNKNTQEPSRRLLIVFDHYTVPSNDTGDVFTVNSYDKERFATDVPYIDGIVRASDTLDFRPRVSFFDPLVTTDRSPFDFNARTSTFNTVPLRILAPGEGSIVTESFYLPRIDKIYLDTAGNFIVDKGVSSKTPKAPVKKSELLEIGTINLPAYLYRPQEAFIILTDNRRYTMRDIGFIEDRVSTLEEVTSLSFLELSTETLQIRDSEGKDRFKSGFFVDDFSNFSRINPALSFVTVDTASNNLIPLTLRDSLESLVATQQNLSPEDLDLTQNLPLLDSSIQKTGRVLTLAYEEIDWLQQPFATRVENVNPFNVVVYTGTIQLQPEVDNWTRTVQLADVNVDRGIVRRQSVDLTNNLRQDLNLNLNSTEINRVADPRRRGTTDTGGFSFSGSTSSRSSSTASGSFDTVDTTIRNEVVGRPDEVFMRSRNTEFKVSNLKANTRFYQFLDGNSNVDVVPKLIEVANDVTLQNYGSSSAFRVGETVIGTVNGVERIRFRVCTPNHKFGPFNNPESTYNINPYIKTENIGNVYSSTTKVLNVDTASLSEVAQGDYFGYIVTGMQLVGQTSGAISYVKDIRLISDNYGDLIGTFFLRDPNASPPPTVRIPTGTKTYRITSSPTNDPGLPGSNSISFAERNYSATATLLQFQATVTRETTRTTINSTINLETNLSVSATRRVETEYFDPLAQTFTVGGNIQVKSNIDTDDDVNGVFLTSVDLFFASIDSGNAEVRVEVRTTQLGTPTLEVIGKPVILRPRTTDADGNEVINIQTSATGEIPTNVKFPEPIFLAPGREYAIVIISDKSDGYELWTAVMGEKTVNTRELPDVDAVRYTQQFALGSLFKSQNGSIWTTDQYQDLKFKLYKAQFIRSTGTAYFYNPPLSESNGYLPTLVNNPITILPKTGKIGINTVTDSTIIGILTTGRKLSGSNGNGGSAIIVGQGSSVSSATTLTVSGENYPASVTNQSVSTYNIVGNGQNLKLLITTNSSGTITGVAHSTVDFGSGYQVGDVVGIVTSSTSTQTGRNARITIGTISGLDTLYLTNVQGEFGAASSGKEFAVGAALSYYGNSGTIVSMAGTTIISATSDGGVNSGNYIKVDHFNHGMYSTTNKLILKEIESSEPSTSLSTNLIVSETSTISVANTSVFITFEGQIVSGSYPGYVKIGREIIKYDSVGNGSISIASGGRGIDGTVSVNHSVGEIVQKYELGGVSLRRVNGVNSNISGPIGMDSYYVEIDMDNTNGNDRSGDATTSGAPQLSFNDLRLLGGNKVTASQNIIYNAAIPTYDILTPGSLTSVNATMRTITGTSIDGIENSFNDNGFEPIQLNTLNTFNSVRLICSEANQNEYLTNLPRKKSLTTAITFNSNDSNLSPVLNLDTAFTEFYINRLNQPIADYSLDNRVNSILDDPHASVYYSNLVSLQNPASTLKVILTAERPADTDFRVLYNLIKADSSEIEQSFELFPGYNNLNETTDGFIVVDPSKNSGLPDRRVPSSLFGEFLEYEFTAENLDLFIGFTIKIVISSTNQAQTTRFRDIRTIAIR